MRVDQAVEELLSQREGESKRRGETGLFFSLADSDSGWCALRALRGYPSKWGVSRKMDDVWCGECDVHSPRATQSGQGQECRFCLGNVRYDVFSRFTTEQLNNNENAR
jgi:hypothetical protein